MFIFRAYRSDQCLHEPVLEDTKNGFITLFLISSSNFKARLSVPHKPPYKARPLFYFCAQYAFLAFTGQNENMAHWILRVLLLVNRSGKKAWVRI